MAIVPGIRALNWRSLWLPFVCVAAVAGALIAVLILAAELGGSDAPPEAPPFRAPAASPFVSQDVKQRDGPTLQLIRQQGQTAVESTFVVPSGLPLERLQPASPADLQPGDHITIMGVANDYNTFAVRFIVALSGAKPGPDGFPRTPAGFTGYEASRDPNDRPQLTGTLERIDGNDLVLAGPDGPIVVHVEPEARFFRVESVTVDDIVDGDRVAGAFDSAVTALLVMPGS